MSESKYKQISKIVDEYRNKGDYSEEDFVDNVVGVVERMDKK